jgi:hypothetical protein
MCYGNRIDDIEACEDWIPEQSHSYPTVIPIIHYYITRFELFGQSHLMFGELFNCHSDITNEL